jgi:predicted DNA-binding transcriptional regulator AlpA
MAAEIVTFGQLSGLGVPHPAHVLRQMWLCGGFPPPFTETKHRLAWKRSDIERWLREPCRDLSDEPWLHPIIKSSWVHPGRGA